MWHPFHTYLCFSINVNTHTHRYGTASFCRTGTYGMPQFITNTMRVCTRDAPGATYDASVPVKPLFYNSSVLPTFEGAEEMCSETPFDVPWSMEDAAAAENPAAQFSLGCVPMWDGSPVDMNPVYPSDAYTAQLDNTDPGTLKFQRFTFCTHTQKKR